MTFFVVYEIYNKGEMIIYVDILFLENFILDFILLLATKMICGSHWKILRMILASFIGGIYTVFAFASGLRNSIVDFIVSLLMVWISFGIQNKRYFQKHLGVFYLASIVFGGASLLFASFDKLFKVLICGAITGFVLVVGIQKLLQKKFEKICEIEIGYQGKSVKTKALIDSRQFIKRKNFKFTSHYCRRK